MTVRDEFETRRLVVRALHPEDLDALLDVYASNPGYLAMTEGSAGEPGRYDKGMLERDFTVAAMMPERRTLGIRRKPSGELIGALDWAKNRSDADPLIGLLIIRADQQRHGFATEAFEGFVQQLHPGGNGAVSARTIAQNVAGRAFADRLGFLAVPTTAARTAADKDVIVLERALH